MTAVSNAPGLPSSRLHLDADSLTTMPEPHSPDEFPSPQRSNNSSPHPDLSSEVATLSNKLISAINHQTNLDDSLAATRQELEISQKKARQLEIENQRHVDLVASGALVKKAEAEEQASRLVAKLVEERKRRTVVEKDKKGIEQELENLTTALFEEANRMVAAARKEREAAERRTDQLRAQLNDTELLLASHQEQLAELKAVMERMNSDREDLEAVTNGSTGPSTPALPTHGDLGRALESLHISSSNFGMDGISPAPPSSFAHLFSPVLRTDLQSYEDFRSLLQIPRKSAPGSRVNSGSYNGATASTLNNLPHRDGVSHPTHLPSNGSTTSLSTPASFNPSLSTTANVPASTMSNVALPGIPLKETRFYKRALTEDIEPTLRLDTAPGLSWLVRRNIIPTMCEGSLVVEPMPASNKTNIFPCALCGENRKGEEFARTHRFRTSENENSQRYPLCSYCLNRVRSTCDYLGFLRMIKDGHWRTDGAEAEKSAWEESVRLRERMFWSRIGGGVVPAIIARESPRVSIEETKPRTPFSAPPILRGSSTVEKMARLKENKGPLDQEVTLASRERVVQSPQEDNDESKDDWEIARHDNAPSPRHENDPPSRQLHTSLRESLQPRPRSRAASYERERAVTRSRDSASQRASTPSRSTTPRSTTEQGLQITIPGAFKF